MNEVFERIYRENYTPGESGKLLDAIPAAIIRDDAIQLYNLTKEVPHTASTIETGMAFGLSALAFCQAHQEKGGGMHIAIDPYQKLAWDNAGLLAVKQAGLSDYLAFLEERSFAALPRLYAEGKRYDVAFIDGNHRFEHAFLDFFYIDRMLNVGGIVMLHDTYMHSLRKVLSYIVRFRFNEYEMYHPLMGGGQPVWKKAISFLTHLKEQPYEVCAARSLAAIDCPRYMVFKKKAHLTDEEFDMQWEFNTAF